jgi:uncharacterized glyoxalase superfamily protein PhnB
VPSTAIPTLRYHDAPAAIDFLVDAFGFGRHLVVEDGAGGIAHAQLTLGDGMMMLGSVSEGRPFDAMITTVRDSGAKPTSCPFLVIADVPGVAERVVAAGGQILDPVADQDHGGQAFTCADPEGNLWNVGSYDPWATT